MWPVPEDAKQQEEKFADGDTTWKLINKKDSYAQLYLNAELS